MYNVGLHIRSAKNVLVNAIKVAIKKSIGTDSVVQRSAKRIFDKGKNKTSSGISYVKVKLSDFAAFAKTDFMNTSSDLKSIYHKIKGKRALVPIYVVGNSAPVLQFLEPSFLKCFWIIFKFLLISFIGSKLAKKFVPAIIILTCVIVSLFFIIVVIRAFTRPAPNRLSVFIGIEKGETISHIKQDLDACLRFCKAILFFSTGENTFNSFIEVGNLGIDVTIRRDCTLVAIAKALNMMNYLNRMIISNNVSNLEGRS